MSRINPAFVVMSSQTVANGASIFSSSYSGSYANALSGVLVKLTGSGTVTINQQCSFDDTTYYDAVDGTGTALGAVCTALTSTAGVYVGYTAVSAPFKRFKIVAAANSTVSISVISGAN